jgi:hypothetical protein
MPEELKQFLDTVSEHFPERETICLQGQDYNP